jgi:FMN phosphatase YigB (HAD superfamily)
VEAELGFDRRRTLFVDDSLPVLRAARDHGIEHIVAVAHPDSTQTQTDSTQTDSTQADSIQADLTPGRRVVEEFASVRAVIELLALPNAPRMARA